ncbi:hypothetical protein HYPSUDRAFT_191636 [Hypholoma sublateritium FD-334 SS-4]|uniref:U3 small nucleolar RNA-associated protein 10 n=1 Tax=Hypholoma sublateritium (strain FD-334 SS-4) TaxID=945553 RepID=A0A0D2M3S2_HYPSF|nr:hypothetical protein HYPSUDRAFT_191636 [Hypholoma sublateritium FD-334 SS-4]
MSSLAAQLAQTSSLNASLLVDRSRRKATLSYLFTGREADQHDIEAIHALGVNSLIHLSSIHPGLAKYEELLFSDRAKDTDRTLLPTEEAAELNKTLEEFLWLLSPYLLEPPTGKIIEWLVRRFRVHEFNVEAVLSLFLPYHESPHFAKLVTILSIKPNSTWSFLIPYKSAAQNVPRVSLVTEMLKNTDLARFVTSLLPTSLKKGVANPVLIAFNAATLHDFIKRSKSLTEGTVAYLVPALLDPLQQKAKKLSKDAVIGSYILLASLSQKCQMSPAALKISVNSMTVCAHVVRGEQYISALIAVCQPQPILDEFSGSTLKALLKLPQFKEDLVAESTWVGIEKVLSPLVRGLIQNLQNSTAVTLLEGIISMKLPPHSVIEISTASLLSISIKHDADNQGLLVSRRLLSLIQQVHPEIFGKSVDEVCGQDESVKEAVEQLLISLSMPSTVAEQGNAQESIDMILASANADAKVRSAAVKGLLKSISDKSVSAIEDIDNIRSTLIARVQDTNVEVLEALYEHPEAITPIFASSPKEYLSSLSTTMTSQNKLKRNLVRLHLGYLASSFAAEADASTQKEIFHQILFPFLLFSKSRQKTTELVWDVIDSILLQLSGGVIAEWLSGCPAFVNAGKVTEDVNDDVDSMNQLNHSIAEKIAQNIIGSEHFTINVDSVIGKLSDSRSYVKLLSHLIALSLIKTLSGESQIEVAQRVLSLMNLDELAGIDDLSQEHLTLNSTDDISLGKYIITKPSSKTTLSWLQISIITAISSIPAPSDVVFDWITETTPVDEDKAHLYISLMRSIYQLANASTTVPVISTTILQILFVTLKGDALAFLAGIWSTGSNDTVKDSQGISLLHAAAFLEAHIQEDDGVDFQTILPALLVALQSNDTQICQGALACISRVRILAEHNFSSVYRFDTIYGENDRALQYLDQEDFKHYLNALVEHRDHFANDPSYLKVFHAEHLGRTKVDKKKDIEYKHRITCYLLSHINALSSETVQIALLKSIAMITNTVKIQILLPTLQALVETASKVHPNDISSVASEEFTTRILSCLDSFAASCLNETEEAWVTFTKLIRVYLCAGAPLPAQQALVHSFENGLFTSLNQQRKITLCELLLEVGAQDSSAQSLSRHVLATILMDVPLIIHLLESLTPARTTSSPRATKRVKTTEIPEDMLPRLSLLVEILGTKSLPGSLDLITHLLDTLSKVVQTLPPTQADVSYIEQLLMSAIESAASKVKEAPNLSPTVIRLDILVEVIRVSGNPQTFQQALLLIANLARLAPDSVLYNVMPVFTFMGSNVFHRDDSYSFKVVQQTIEGIVPVMVSSLKEAHSQPLDLYIASREFLRVFTDAANHIPRHRRNNFFAHLVDVLGPRDFSAAVCMLLLEKSASRVIRQTPEEIQNSLSLPISVFQRITHELQAYTATEILNECQRIVTHILDSKSTEAIFLDTTPDGDHSVSSATILRRRVQALIVFIGFAYKSKASIEGGSISNVIAQLIRLATLSGGNSADTKMEEISEVARSSLNRLLSAMSVVNFMQAVETMLDSGDVKVQAGALELLAKRLPDVSAKARPGVSTSVISILTSIKHLTTTQKDGQVIVHAFHALESIASTICPGEESLLTELVPFTLSGTKDSNLAKSALAALAPMSVKLGPRIIPFFRNIISQSITILRGVDNELFGNAFAILDGLLSTIPTFWGSGEVTQVALLYIDQSSSDSKHMGTALNSLAKSLAKRAPAKVLLPTLLEMWQSLQSSRQMSKISAYFEVVTRALQHADRATVLSHLRASFKIFLEALDIVRVDEKAQSSVIAAFKELTVKLNEAAFKPLFRRLFDWAFVEDPADNARKTTFGALYITFLDFFKGLMVPYMSFLLAPFCDILASFATSDLDDFGLWSTVVQTLTQTLNYDDGAFWRDDKLRQLSVPLTSQIAVCVKPHFVDGKQDLQDCLTAVVENVVDETILKTVNLNILMHTRSEDSRARITALAVSQALWRSNGGKLMGFVTETATFIAECGEDENDMVVKESFKLKDAVESVAGKIDGL